MNTFDEKYYFRIIVFSSSGLINQVTIGTKEWYAHRNGAEYSVLKELNMSSVAQH